MKDSPFGLPVLLVGPEAGPYLAVTVAMAQLVGAAWGFAFQRFPG